VRSEERGGGGAEVSSGARQLEVGG
jgi:hypothetical protein